MREGITNARMMLLDTALADLDTLEETDEVRTLRAIYEGDRKLTANGIHPREKANSTASGVAPSRPNASNSPNSAAPAPSTTTSSTPSSKGTGLGRNGRLATGQVRDCRGVAVSLAGLGTYDLD